MASNLKVKLDLLTYIDILSMVRKCVQAGICPAIYKCVKANKKYIKNHDRNKESSYFQYWDVNNIYGLVISQKFPVNAFKWVEETSQSNEDSKRIYNYMSGLVLKKVHRVIKPKQKA